MGGQQVLNCTGYLSKAIIFGKIFIYIVIWKIGNKTFVQSPLLNDNSGQLKTTKLQKHKTVLFVVLIIHKYHTCTSYQFTASISDQ